MLQVFNHTCRYKCNENISETKRQELFEKFYKLPTYDLQTAYLSTCIFKVAPKRRKSNKPRNFSTKIMLLNKRVCKEFFLRTFDISNRRFTMVYKKTNDLGMCEVDQRGKQPSVNKIDQDSRNFIIQHIKQFPRYRSHYSQKDNSDTRYLSPELNISKMYSLYKEKCVESNKVPTKLSYYWRIFNKEFNLRFHRPHTDTCSRCDSLQNIIKHSTNEVHVKSAKVSLEIHQREAEKACKAKDLDVITHKNRTDTAVVCFDLQQTLPTPLLATSRVFYLRQLWTYNFCVHNLLTGEADMYSWDETVAGRGSEEIGSCLIHFIKSLSPNVTKLIAYSDSCGGQNKNKNICKLFMFLIKSTHLKEIHHKFLEPGHTYMECDRNFALIEKNKKRNPQVFIPDHWRTVIASSSKKFNVHNMNQEMFYPIKSLDQVIKDFKKDSEGKPLQFRKIACFKYEKDKETFSFQFKYSVDLDSSLPYKHCTCGSHSAGRPTFSLESILLKINKTPLPITQEKWKNLQSLLDYIPPIYHEFYKNMPHHKPKGKRTQRANTKTTPAAKISEVDTSSDDEHFVNHDIDSDYD